VEIGTVLVVLVAAAPSVLARWTDATGHPLSDARDVSLTIEIPEVDCAGCSPAIRHAVNSLGGVVHISDGDATNRIVVAYEPGAGRPDAYVTALRAAGYPKAHEVARSP
jgi:hypothetical protein